MQFSATLISAIIASASVAAVPAASADTLTPLCTDIKADSCSAVDPAKYLGTWYEQGRSQVIRGTFEKDCNCVTADYKLKPDGKNVQVTNSCVNAKTNAFNPIVGNAAILSNSELKVSFGDSSVGGQIGQFFQNLIPGPNYVIKNVWTDADGNYKRALVTYGKALGPFQFIWVLSRDPVISDADLKETLDFARANGFNPSEASFQRTPCTDAQRAVLDASNKN